MEQTNNNVDSKTEGNLDELLDSCLDDFNKPLQRSTNKTQDTSAANSSNNVNASPTSSNSGLLDDLNWGEEFKHLQNVMENALENESELNELRNLMGNLEPMSNLTPEALAESFSETIKGLTEGAQNIPDVNPEELANLFSNFDLGDSGQQDLNQLPELMPLMHNIMQKLMSKELLYPSLKEIVDKYPIWLAEKRPSLKEQEYEQYNKQYNLMKNVCSEFENDSNDSEEAKKASFEKILMLMQQIQNCGNPPKELVSDIGQNAPFDEHGNLSIPGAPQQCIIM